MPNRKSGDNLQIDRLSKRQAIRLSELTGVEADAFVDKRAADLFTERGFHFDYQLLFARKVCGRVVKTDPATGEQLPVPFATVHVEDTDCSLLGYFPSGSIWCWYFPIKCRREVIATVKTDACGNFCVWIPNFEIDWILRWRLKTVCSPDIFVRPSIRDLLGYLDGIPVRRPLPKPWPDPDPDPAPIRLLHDGGLTMRRVEALLGPDVAGRLAQMEGQEAFRGKVNERSALLHADAFPRSRPLGPTLPAELLDGGRKLPEILREKYNIDPDYLRRVNWRRWVGPFRICWKRLVPEWSLLLDVPDITFRVTQDVDGDGDEETIYSEGFFDVRWNAGYIPPVTLEAATNAIAGLTCGAPHIECQDLPAIHFAGLMPVENPVVGDPYLDGSNGYATRTNRPLPPGPRPLGETPFAGRLLLHGCTNVDNAECYRVQYSTDEGSTWNTFTGLRWPIWPESGGPIHWVEPDADGWYPVLATPEDWFPENLMLSWPTGVAETYDVRVQVADGAKNVLNQSAPVRFTVDNTTPTAEFTSLEWSTDGINFADLSLVCATVRRPANQDIYFRVRYAAGSLHLRNFALSAGGCGGSSGMIYQSGVTAHWHQTPADNHLTPQAVFRLNGSSPEGAYSFHLVVNSRAFNPSDPDGHAADWYYDDVTIWRHAYLPIAVVNE